VLALHDQQIAGGERFVEEIRGAVADPICSPAERLIKKWEY
jgi:hypothetical protein